MMIINHYNGDIMTSSLTLPGSGFHLPRRKHSLHDVLDWDRPETTPQSDTLQRIVDIVKRTGESVPVSVAEVLKKFVALFVSENNLVLLSRLYNVNINLSTTSS